MKIKIDAYAKINLHLDITGIRDDGYHNIQSVMHSISICDTVELECVDGEDIIIECDTEGVPLDEKNIAHKAARLFFAKTDIKSGVIIKIKKNIPMAAGLAGGSADGAAVLLGLNRLFDEALCEKELYLLGSALGADVPFCMSCGCCYTTGIGDKMVKVEPLSDNTVLVVACGGEGVSTPEAYRMLDKKYNNFTDYELRNCQALMQSLADQNCDFYKHIFNIFEEPISSVRPAVKLAKGIMFDNRAKAAMMSGSGPSVFGIFEDVENAENAVKALKAQGCFASVASPVKKRIF